MTKLVIGHLALCQDKMESKQSTVGKAKISLVWFNLLVFLGQDAGEDGAESYWVMAFCIGFPAGPCAHLQQDSQHTTESSCYEI